jgi:hypothetical protein
LLAVCDSAAVVQTACGCAAVLRPSAALLKVVMLQLAFNWSLASQQLEFCHFVGYGGCVHMTKRVQ